MSGESGDRTATWIATIALVAIALAFWGDCIFGPWTPLAAGFQAQMQPWASEADLPGTDRQWSPLLWDSVAQFYPWRLLLARSMRGGELALWNPHQMCGYPFLSNAQSALFYPPNWLLPLFEVKWGMGLLSWLHYALAAVLTMLFGRKLGLGALPAAFVGIAFAFGGFMVTWTELPTLINSATWLPGALLGVALIYERRRWGLPLLGASLAMALLAGHLQIAAYVWMVALVYALARALWEAVNRRAAHLGRLGAAVALGLLLSAPQTLPALELAANSPRGAAGPSEAGWQFQQERMLQVAELVLLVNPDAFGNPAHGDHELTRYGIPYSEHCGFVGIVTLLLALLGAWFSRTRSYAFFAALAVLSLHVAMGGPLAEAMYFYLPKLGQAGSFTRFLSVFTFAAAMAAGLGLEGICRYLKQRDEAAGDEGYCGWNLCAPAGLCVVALVVLCYELLPWAHTFLPRTRREHVYPMTPSIERLMAAEGRVLTVTPREGWSMARVPEAVLPPNSATVYGYDAIGGYDSLMLTRFRAFLSASEGTEVAPPPNGNMLLPMAACGPGQALMGLDTVIARRQPEPAPGHDCDDWGLSVTQSLGGTAIWRVAEALPRAFVAPDWQELQQIAADDPTAMRAAVASCEWERSGNAAIRVAVPVEREGDHLVATETFAPGWSAYVDGRRREAVPFGDTFISVILQSDDTEVRFVYESSTIKAGCFVGMLGLAALMVAATWRSGRYGKY